MPGLFVGIAIVTVGVSFFVGERLAAGAAVPQEGEHPAGLEGAAEKGTDVAYAREGVLAREPVAREDDEDDKKKDKKKSRSKKDDDEKKDKKKGSKKRDRDEDEDEDPDEGKKKKRSKKTVLDDPDFAYVKDNLETFLSPTEFELKDDGRVEMTFDFGERDSAHEEIFTRRIGGRLQDPFRWSLEDESYFAEFSHGIRISNRGVVFLKAWFHDDLQVEMRFLQYINWSRRHQAAILFGSPKRAIGCNYGSQCAYFRGNRMGTPAGKASPAYAEKMTRFKLRVKDGVFEAYRDGVKRSAKKYSGKSLESGRIGFCWGGSLSAIVPSLKIKGKLDVKKTAEEIRKGFKAQKKKKRR